jgi:hypothetical protein
VRGRTGRGKASGAITLGLDNSMEFVCGETFLTQYPLFAGCRTTEKIGPACVGYDPDSGSNIAMQLSRSGRVAAIIEPQSKL